MPFAIVYEKTQIGDIMLLTDISTMIPLSNIRVHQPAYVKVFAFPQV